MVYFGFHRFYVLDTILKFVIILVAGAFAWFLFNLAFN